MSTEYFFSSGVFGCTHYPSMKCDGKQSNLVMKNKNPTISKLTAYDNTAKNEYLIGKKLKDVQDKHDNMIVVVERMCKINKKNVNKITREYEDCDKIVQRKRSRKYVLFFSKYFKSVTASKYIRSNISLQAIFRVYFFAIKSTALLKKNNVVHMDFHMGNVIYDIKKKFHLIDFGLALDLDRFYKTNSKGEVDYKLLRKSLGGGHNPEWFHFPIEVHILSFLLFQGQELSKQILTSIIDYYYDSVVEDSKHFKTLFGDLDTYKYSVFEHYSKKFVNKKPIKEHILEIVSAACHSWDMYRVCRYVVRNLHVVNQGYLVSKLKSKAFESLHFDYEKRPTSEALASNDFLLGLNNEFK